MSPFSSPFPSEFLDKGLLSVGGGGAGRRGPGAVVERSEQVSDTPEIKGVCSASRGRFAVCLLAGDVARFKYQIRPTNEDRGEAS